MLASFPFQNAGNYRGPQIGPASPAQPDEWIDNTLARYGGL
jgi:hypothetical protein